MPSISQITGDSTARSVSYMVGMAEVRIRDGETDNEYLVRIRTPVFFSECYEETGSVRVQLDRLDQHLPVHPDSGRYQMPDSFELQMEAVRRAHHLALGLKASEYPLMLRILGYRTLLACPIRAESDIEVSDAVG